MRLRSIKLAFILLLALTSPLAAQYRLTQAEVVGGANSAASANYRLQGCIAHGPAGRASSASYVAYTGCGASALLLASDTVAGTPEEDLQPIPVGGKWSLLLGASLMLTIGLVARRRRAA
jgi:hypothetical protein